MRLQQHDVRAHAYTCNRSAVLCADRVFVAVVKCALCYFTAPRVLAADKPPHVFAVAASLRLPVSRALCVQAERSKIVRHVERFAREKSVREVGC